MRALSIAATGMSAQQTNTEVIANNIANISTTGFKRARAEFTDLLYQTERVAGTPGRSAQNPVPEGIQVGLGVRTVAVRSLHIQGALTNTNNKLDLALNGRGWFQVANANGDLFYTRTGSFNRNANGQMVTADGNVLQPGISIPTSASEIIIGLTGQVSVRTGSSTTTQIAGQVTLATFVNDAGLEAIGGNLFKETVASGSASIGVPGDPGLATLHQGYLESSNVDPVKEITELISAQRSYEMNAKIMQAVDEMMGTVAKGIR
jgi:flagellar basal-body rod protein FlgG